ncbi:MAG: sulfite exporter TauE/SafE family protein [Granulosicoccus sp.]
MPTLDTVIAGGPLLWSLLFASLFVGLSKGGLPGIGMLAVPLLALLISPVVAAVLLLPIYILSDAVGIWLYRKEYSLENLKILIPAGILGVVVGWSTATLVSDEIVSLLIGLLGMGFCLDRWVRQSSNAQAVKPSLLKGVCWGTLSGFTSFVSHAGAPPYQVYMLPQQLPKMIFAGTTTILFAVVNLAKLVPYYSMHPPDIESLSLALILVPIAALGTVLGRWLIQHLSEKWFYLVVQVALFLISLRLVASYLS